MPPEASTSSASATAPLRDHAPWPAPEVLARLAAGVQSLTGFLRLPFHRQVWKGQTGNWLGTGIGSSIDFQDHRPYLPGDDPRYIDWQAYARTGHYIMKLYREEVSPTVDLVLDASTSMTVTPAKTVRATELLYFVASCADQAGASLRVWLTAGQRVARLDGAQVAAHRWPGHIPELPREKVATDPAPVPLDQIAWRRGALRIVITDLLYPGQPEELLRPMLAMKGQGILLAPFDARAEAEPDWDGNVQFVDCETTRRQSQRVEPTLLAEYRAAYRRHFSLWGDQARRRNVLLARVPAGGTLLEALRAEALPQGVLELNS